MGTYVKLVKELQPMKNSVGIAFGQDVEDLKLRLSDVCVLSESEVGCLARGYMIEVTDDAATALLDIGIIVDISERVRAARG